MADSLAMHGRAQAYEQGLKLSAQGRHLDAIVCFEQALAQKPDDTKVLFALGNTARALGLAGPAESFFRQVLALEPQRLEAQVNLANLMRAQGQFAAALALLQPALARNAQSPELHVTLGSVWRESGDWEEAANCYRAALALNPHYVPALCNLADLLTDDADIDAARTLYDQALKSDPGNAQARLNRAVLHLSRGDLKEGWRDHAARVDIPGKVPISEQRLSAWTGGHLRKTRLLVRAEQGVGDQIMFASTFPELAARAAEDGGSVVLECEPRLAPLFVRSFPNCTVRPAVFKAGPNLVADYAWLKQAGGANAAILMGSLPRYLRSDLDSFPTPNVYLKPDGEEQARWTQFFAGHCGPAIGICWRSGKSGGHRAVQYAPLAAWGEFLRELPGTIICAQYDATAEEIAELERLSGRAIVVPAGLDQKNELDRTAAMLSALDVVVSAPTAVSWLSAACGVKTLKVLYDTSWTAFGQVYEPFAPSCLCVMPKQRGDWTEVFAQSRRFIAQL
jgi:tetratricopeptide (TPR) repeat protein